MPVMRQKVVRWGIAAVAACAVCTALLLYLARSGRIRTGSAGPGGPTAPAAKRSSPSTNAEPAPPPVERWEDVDRAIAAFFAPTFYQGVIGRERFDYITNFDFDGDWQGDNNWRNASDPRYPMKAFVYYAVTETPTHYFIHYAAFHPRDWKGGEKTGRILSTTVHESATIGGTIKARGVLDDIVFSHENDLEGCLVVAAKHGPGYETARVVLVETMAHNRYLRFSPEADALPARALRLDEQHPLLYVEAQGHGIEAFHGQSGTEDVEGEESTGADASIHEKARKRGIVANMKRVLKAESFVTDRMRVEGKPTTLLVYRYAGRADDPETMSSGRPIGYDLTPLYSTLWRAASTGTNQTFGEAVDYGTQTILAISAGPGGVTTIGTRQIRLGTLGAALRGVAGGRNRARAPWAWFDRGSRSRPLGEWFFDPAGTILREGRPQSSNWATAYLHQPFLGIIRPPSVTKGPSSPIPAG
jgi:hypothetical protein